MPYAIDPQRPSPFTSDTLFARAPSGTTFVATALLALLFFTAPVGAAPAMERADQQQVRGLIAHTYDQPAHKVETDPIAITGNYAIADWIQGERGGRALLRKTGGAWEILVCGGDGLKQADALHDAGIPAKDASELLRKLGEVERTVSKERLRRFGLFDQQSSTDAHHAHH